MNLSQGHATSYGETAGAVPELGPAHAAPAHLGGCVGWTAEDSMAASIVRLECQVEESNARIAVLEEQARILAAERDEALLRVRNCGQHMIQVSEELDAGEGEIALDAAARAMGRLRRAERERDEAIRYIAALEERVDSATLKAAQEAAK